MTLNHHFRVNSEKRFKRFSLVLFSMFILFLSNSSLAAECQQWFYTNDGSDGSRPYKAYYTDTGLTPEQCDKTVSLSGIDYINLKANADSASDLTSMINVLKDLFEFNPDDFAAFVAGCLVVFITGHATGRILRLFGKA